jgi:cell division septation protein DedD
MENKERTGEENLSDIVFSDPEKGKSTKKIVVAGAVATILAIIGINVVSTSSPENDEIKSIKNSTKAEEDPFFNDSPADALSKAKFDENEKPLQKRTVQTEQVNDFANKKNISTGGDDSSGIRDTLLNGGGFDGGEDVIAKTTPILKTEIQQPQKKATNSNVKTDSETETKKVVSKKQVEKSNESKYYIQIGIYKTAPDIKLTKKIASAKLEYIVSGVTRNGKDINRMLVGPFEFKADANKELFKIRTQINQNAFIFKTKLK